MSKRVEMSSSVPAFRDDEPFLAMASGRQISFDDLTFRSSPGSPVAASTVARPVTTNPKENQRITENAELRGSLYGVEDARKQVRHQTASKHAQFKLSPIRSPASSIDEPRTVQKSRKGPGKFDLELDSADTSDVQDFIRTQNVSQMLEKIDLSDTMSTTGGRNGPTKQMSKNRVSFTGGKLATQDWTSLHGEPMRPPDARDSMASIGTEISEASSLGILQMDDMDMSSSLVHVDSSIHKDLKKHKPAAPDNDKELDTTMHDISDIEDNFPEGETGEEDSRRVRNAMENRQEIEDGSDGYDASDEEAVNGDEKKWGNRHYSTGGYRQQRPTDSGPSSLQSSMDRLDSMFFNHSDQTSAPQRPGSGDGGEVFLAPTRKSPVPPSPSRPSWMGSQEGAVEGRDVNRVDSRISGVSIKFDDNESIGGDDDQYFRPEARGKATGIDSVESSEIDTEDELAAVRKENAYLLQPMERLCVGDSGESSEGRLSRPGLEGGSSDENEDVSFPTHSGLSMRQSAEGEVVSPVPGDGGGGGDGMSDGETGSSVTVPSVVTGGHSAFDIQRGLGMAMSVQGVAVNEGRNVEGQSRSQPVGDGIVNDAPPTRQVRFASMERTYQRTLSESEYDYSGDLVLEFTPNDANVQTADASLSMNMFLAPTPGHNNISQTSTNSTVNASTNWMHNASSFHMSQMSGFQDDERNDRAVGGSTESLDRTLTPSSAISYGNAQNDPPPDFVRASSLGDFGANEQDFTFSQKLSFGGEGEFSEMFRGSFSSEHSSDRHSSDREGPGGLRESTEGAPQQQQQSPRTDSSNQESQTRMSFGKLGFSEPEQHLSPVYFDRNGEGVTDLAFRTSLQFVHNQGVRNPFDTSGDQQEFADQFGAEFGAVEDGVGDLGLGDEEFVSADIGAAVLDKDEKAFEEEHVFEQDDAMSPPVENEFSNWSIPSTNHEITGDESFCRISIGTFMSKRTEALGSLSGDCSVRPNFGDGEIISPPSQAPVAILDQYSPPDDSPPSYNNPSTTSERYSGVGEYTQENSHLGQQNQDFAQEDPYRGQQNQDFAQEDSYRGQQNQDFAKEDSHLGQQNQDFANHQSGARPKLSGQEDDYRSTGANENGSIEMRHYFDHDDSKISDASESDVTLNLPDEQVVLPYGGQHVAHQRIAELITDAEANKSGSGMKTPPLQISAIASAIADASSTTKAEDLAAMIMAFSNKQRDKLKGKSAQSEKEEKNKLEGDDGMMKSSKESVQLSTKTNDNLDRLTSSNQPIDKQTYDFDPHLRNERSDAKLRHRGQKQNMSTERNYDLDVSLVPSKHVDNGKQREESKTYYSSTESEQSKRPISSAKYTKESDRKKSKLPSRQRLSKQDGRIVNGDGMERNDVNPPQNFSPSFQNRPSVEEVPPAGRESRVLESSDRLDFENDIVERRPKSSRGQRSSVGAPSHENGQGQYQGHQMVTSKEMIDNANTQSTSQGFDQRQHPLSRQRDSSKSNVVSHNQLRNDSEPDGEATNVVNLPRQRASQIQRPSQLHQNKQSDLLKEQTSQRKTSYSSQGDEDADMRAKKYKNKRSEGESVRQNKQGRSDMRMRSSGNGQFPQREPTTGQTRLSGEKIGQRESTSPAGKRNGRKLPCPKIRHSPRSPEYSQSEQSNFMLASETEYSSRDLEEKSKRQFIHMNQAQQHSPSTKESRWSPGNIQEKTRQSPPRAQTQDNYNDEQRDDISTKETRWSPRHVQDKTRHSPGRALAPKNDNNEQRDDISTKETRWSPRHVQNKTRHSPGRSQTPENDVPTEQTRLSPRHVQEKTSQSPHRIQSRENYRREQRDDISTKERRSSPRHVQDKTRHSPGRTHVQTPENENNEQRDNVSTEDTRWSPRHVQEKTTHSPRRAQSLENYCRSRGQNEQSDSGLSSENVQEMPRYSQRRSQSSEISRHEKTDVVSTNKARHSSRNSRENARHSPPRQNEKRTSVSPKETRWSPRDNSPCPDESMNTKYTRQVEAIKQAIQEGKDMMSYIASSPESDDSIISPTPSPEITPTFHDQFLFDAKNGKDIEIDEGKKEMEDDISPVINARESGRRTSTPSEKAVDVTLSRGNLNQGTNGQSPSLQQRHQPVSSFQAFPNGPHFTVNPPTTTPTLLTSQSLMTTSQVSQYLNDRPIIHSRPMSSLSSHGIPTTSHLQSHPQASHDPQLYCSRGIPEHSIPATTTAPYYSHQHVQPQLQQQGASFGHLPPSVGMVHHLQSTYPSAGQFVQSLPNFPGMPHGGLPAGMSATSMIPPPQMHAAANTGTLPISSSLVVPDHLRFKDVCCLGIASQSVLPLHNPGNRWLQCTLEIVSITANGEEISNSPPVFIIKPRTIISPHTTDEMKILFAPHQPGMYTAKVQVGASPVVSDSEARMVHHMVPQMVTLTALAERPNVEFIVDDSKTKILDFGEMGVGLTRSKKITIVNKGQSTVPMRLLLTSSSSAWHYFSLTVESEKSNQSQAGSSASRPLHITLEGKKNKDSTPSSSIVCVHFKAPPDQVYGASSKTLAPPDSYFAKLEGELDVPGRQAMALAGLDLKAVVGVARLLAPTSMQALSFSSTVGRTTSRNLPLKNAGNIKLTIAIDVTQASELFKLVPEEMEIKPGQENDVLIKYSPEVAPSVVESLLTMQIKPDGPKYEVVLRGEATVGDRKRERSLENSERTTGDEKLENPVLLCNKQYIAWGGVPVGRALQQKIVLRNSSDRQSLKLRVSVRGAEEFHLQSSFNSPSGKQDENSIQIIMSPSTDHPLHLLFAPTQVLTYQSTLTIKQSGSSTKYSVPLSGYGGTSKLIMEDVNSIGETYTVNVGRMVTDKELCLTLKARNAGPRAAFVKVISFVDLRAKVKLPASRLSVEPSEFVLNSKASRTLTVMYRVSERESAMCMDRSSVVAAIGFFYGDEITRQQYKRSLQQGQSINVKLSSDNPLTGIEFKTKFVGEDNVHEECDLPLRSNDQQLFFSCMSRMMVTLVGSPSDSDGSDPMANLTLTAVDSPMANVGAERGQMVPFTPPVRDLPDQVTPTPMSVHPMDASTAIASSSPDSGVMSKTWIVVPERLMLEAPKVNVDGSSRKDAKASVVVINYTNRVISFELSWPAHVLSVNPQNGVIQPKSQVVILVSPRHSIYARGVELPWRGHLLIRCDGKQQEVAVQIRQDLALDTSIYPTMDQPQALPLDVVTPYVTREKMQPSAVKVKSKHIKFPQTRVETTSEAKFEFQNITSEEMKWCLSSFASAYVKRDGEVFRATYSVFRFAKNSGSLGPEQKMRVILTFIPRDEGSYSQFWDLNCHPISHSGTTTSECSTRIELLGDGYRETRSSRPRNSKSPVRKHRDSSHNERQRDRSGERSNPASLKDFSLIPKKNTPKFLMNPISLKNDVLEFDRIEPRTSQTQKLVVSNSSKINQLVHFQAPKPPFYVKHSKHNLKPRHFTSLPISFKPTQVGKYQDTLIIESNDGHRREAKLRGECCTFIQQQSV